MSAIGFHHRDPAPSRAGYRLQRLLLTPGFRALVRIGLPLMLLAIIGSVWFSKDENRVLLRSYIAQARAAIEERPEFMVNAMAIDGVDDALAQTIRAALPLRFPSSSFDMDLETIRSTVEALPPVLDARIRIVPGGILQIDVTPRVPVAVWRHQDGLRLIDGNGVFVGALAARGTRSDLPLIAGDGAQAAIDEALALFAASGPLSPRVRGLVRMGERRWDMILDRDQRILLPETGAVRALERIMAIDQMQDLLARDIHVIDLRDPGRLTLRLSDAAASAIKGYDVNPITTPTEAEADN